MNTSMLTIGINCSYHDSSAVAVRNGQVVAAIEEERLNRVKHTNAFPARSIAACLREAHASIEDVGALAVNISERNLTRYCEGRATGPIVPKELSAREFLKARFDTEGAGVLDRLDVDKIRFVPHQLAHAASAYFCSGFEEALVLSIDGSGDEDDGHCAGGVYRASGRELLLIRRIELKESLGFLYGQITKLCGFREFDEYKLMGLASFGQPEAARSIYAGCLELTDDGWFRVDRLRLLKRLTRALGGDQAHHRTASPTEDVAAGCQELLEQIVLHMLAHYSEETGLRDVAIAGGVALNCSMNQKLLFSGRFDQVFVQPAASDAGGALGAALYVAAHDESQEPPRRERLTNVYWGSSLPASPDTADALERWSEFCDVEHYSDGITRVAAEALASGAIIGWVQGRSEFGPRALGNRSILADPRPVANRERVNGVVKRREQFRPFGPSVLQGRMRDYFDVKDGVESLPFMLFTVPVRPEMRRCLGAVTHVDGTARIQTVSREDNERYHDLIRCFGDITGIYALLNTSFNNSAEPMVDSVDDAVTAYLTSGLDCLVVGDFMVRRKPDADARLLDAAVAVPVNASVVRRVSATDHINEVAYVGESALAVRKPIAVSPRTLDLLYRCDGVTPVRRLLEACQGASSDADVVGELRDLWWHRLVRVAPVQMH